MKKSFKITSLLIALVMVIGVLAACGASGGNGGSSVKGEESSWGYYTKVFVPEGYVLKGGDMLNENDKTKMNINVENTSFTYYMFSIFDSEDSVTMSLDTTKEINEGAKDVTLDVGGVKWTGVAYNSLGVDCFSMYAVYGESYVLLNAAGNAYDGEITNAILSSLEINVAE